MVKVASILVLLTISATLGKNLPEFITPCPYSTDPQELGQCVKQVFENNKEKFIQGIPEMHIPVLEPFKLKQIDFNTGNASTIGVHAIFSNVKIEGARNAVLKSVKADIPNREATLEIEIPSLRITGNYNLEGRILVMQINGTGHGEGNFTNLYAINKYNGEFVTKKGKEYIKWSNTHLDLSVKSMSIYFDDLFHNNKELTETTNAVINENSEEILKELKPLVEETISTITFSIVKEVFDKFSVDELFPKAS